MTSSEESPGLAIIFPALVAVALVSIATQTIKTSTPVVVSQEAEQFSDCDGCPQMIRIPSGTFRQGDLQGTGDEDELPVRAVQLSDSFALSRTEVTFAQWDLCVSDGACDVLAEEDGAVETRSQRPVQNASWQDAQAFVAWLTKVSGKLYRLPSESEFEYAARAGSETRYPWGNEPSRDHANYGDDECCRGLDSGADKWIDPAPVASFPPNAFGLHDMAGNVQEWVEDCWQDSYIDAPADGSARVTGGDCSLRGLRGGSWSSTPKMIRPANRDKGAIDARLPYYGFRVARDL